MIEINIKKQLEKAGKTRYWLAKKTGVTRKSIDDMYNNKNARITLDVLDKVCDALDCEISDILIRK